MTGRARHEGGLSAEAAATALYRAEGAEILATRARTAAGEIDLIVAAGDEVVFVEVKTRRTHAAGAAAVSAAQQARIYAAAEIWLAESGRSPLTLCRFDVVTVDAAGSARRLTDAFGG